MTRSIKKLYGVTILIIFFGGFGADIYSFKKTSLDQQVILLLEKMTLEEKVAQMQGVWWNRQRTILDNNFDFSPTKTKENFPYGLGQIGRISDLKQGLTPRQAAEMVNKIQKYFLEETRLGIPVIFHEESLHGLMARDATSFPQPIALGSSWNSDLVRQLYAMAAYETRLIGAHQVLTPVLDIARDPRWGRFYETFGEDPYLTAMMGLAAVQGFQGEGAKIDKQHVLATVKHFAGHGHPESGTNCGPLNVSERVLREVHLYPFKIAIQKGKVASVMASYNEINAIPSHANIWLLRNILRQEWGFKGYVVSDYLAISELKSVPWNENRGYFLTKDYQGAGVLAIQAGVNIELPDPLAYTYNHIKKAITAGTITEKDIDDLVRPMLAAKFRLGLFTNPYADPEKAEQIVGSSDHRQLALKAALESIVLLENNNDILPLSPEKIKTLAVIGPNADRVLLGGYSHKPKQFVTVRQGIEERLKDKVVYAEGCKITVGEASEYPDQLQLAPAQLDTRLISEALETAKQAEIIILVLGGNEQTCREAWSYRHMGDRADLNLIGRQRELFTKISALGKPVIVLLFNGRPLSTTHLARKADALLECWYLGQESGYAVAQVLFGDYNPGGKLPVSIPRSVGHIPCYYNYKPFDRRGYLFDKVSPLYPFGYGLSYTTFKYHDMKLKKKRISSSESVEVSVKVTNTGQREGDEIVQLYIRDLISSVSRPVKELKGFKRVSLVPGKTKKVTFTISPELLSFWNITMNYAVEPGDFKIMIGSSSDQIEEQLILTVH